MSKKRKKELDPTWRYETRTVDYLDSEMPIERFIENLNHAAEGLTNPEIAIKSYGDSDEGYGYVNVTVYGSRPKTLEEIEREREANEWQKQRNEEIKKQIAANEKKEFLRLYKKFGKPN